MISRHHFYHSRQHTITLQIKRNIIFSNLLRRPAKISARGLSRNVMVLPHKCSIHKFHYVQTSLRFWPSTTCPSLRHNGPSTAARG